MTSPAWNSPMTVRCAVSMHSSRSTISRRIPRSATWRSSCGAPTPRVSICPRNAPGLLAISLGLSRLFADDHEQIRARICDVRRAVGVVERGAGETHTWNPQRS